MSDRDVLKRATEALRETSEPSQEDLARLRQRMLDGPNNVTPLRPKSHARRMRWLLPIAAVFVAGTALAATPGGLQTLMELADRYLKVQWLAPAREANHKVKNKPVRSAAPQPAQPTQPVTEVAPAPEQVAETESPAPALPAPTTPVAQAARARRAAPPDSQKPAPEATVAPPEQPRQPSVDLTLYKTAHDLHFRQRDFAAALSAWDEYLELPQASLAMEARYNRALCLVRLARFDEARAALAPFARGEQTGGYRQREAQNLIAALQQRLETKP